MNTNEWKPFQIDTNQWTGLIDSEKEWTKVLNAHQQPGVSASPLNAKRGTNRREIPYFSFQHYCEGETLQEWAEANGMNLAPAVMGG